MLEPPLEVRLFTARRSSKKAQKSSNPEMRLRVLLRLSAYRYVEHTVFQYLDLYRLFISSSGSQDSIKVLKDTSAMSCFVTGLIARTRSLCPLFAQDGPQTKRQGAKGHQLRNSGSLHRLPPQSLPKLSSCSKMPCLHHGHHYY